MILAERGATQWPQLLEGADLSIRILAAACLARIARHPTALGDEARARVLAVLEPVPASIDKAVTAARAATGEVAGGDRHFKQALAELCDARSLPRILTMVGTPSGGLDSVTALVVTVLDHFSTQNQGDEKALADVAERLPQLGRFLEHGAVRSAEDFRIRSRVARLFLQFGHPSAGTSGEPATFAVLDERAQALDLLAREIAERQKATSSRLQELFAADVDSKDKISKGGLDAPLCLGPSSLKALGTDLSEVSGERVTIRNMASKAKDISGLLQQSLAERATEWQELAGSRAELFQKRDELKPVDTSFQASCAELAEREQKLQAARAKAEDCRQESEAAEALAATEKQAETRAEQRLAALSRLEAQASERRERAPGEVEFIRTQVGNCESRRAEFAGQVNDHVREQKEGAEKVDMVKKNMAEAERCVRSVAAVLAELRQVRQQQQEQAVDNPHLAATAHIEDERLVVMENELTTQRPERFGSLPPWLDTEPTSAPDWARLASPLEKLPETPQGTGDFSSGIEAQGARLSLKNVSRYANTVDRFWDEERAWLRAEDERLKRILRGLAKKLEECGEQDQSTLREVARLRAEAAPLEDAEALSARLSQAEAAVADSRSALVTAEAELAAGLRDQNQRRENLGEAREETTAADVAVAEARSDQSEAKLALLEATNTLRAWTQERESSMAENLRLAARNRLRLTELDLVHRRAAQAHGAEFEGRGRVKPGASDIVAQLRALDRQLGAAPHPCLDRLEPK